MARWKGLEPPTFWFVAKVKRYVCIDVTCFIDAILYNPLFFIEFKLFF